MGLDEIKLASTCKPLAEPKIERSVPLRLRCTQSMQSQPQRTVNMLQLLLPLLIVGNLVAHDAGVSASPQVLQNFARNLHEEFRPTSSNVDDAVKQRIRQRIATFLRGLEPPARGSSATAGKRRRGGRSKRDAFGYRSALLDSSKWSSCVLCV